MFVVRDYLFSGMFCLSLVCHATAAWLLGRVDYEPPQLIPPQEGRASIRIRASVSAQAQTQEAVRAPRPEVPVPPAELIQVEERREPLPPDALALPRPLPSQFQPHEAVKPLPAEPWPAEKKNAENASVSSQPSEASAGARVDELPRSIVTNPAPPYPPEALAARQQGTVWLRVKVDAAGLVTAIAVHESSQVAVLDEAALTTVRRWRFHPARRNGVAVPCEFLKPVWFSIPRPS